MTNIWFFNLVFKCFFLHSHLLYYRRAALDWIRAHGETDGVIYFADDDNSYDVRIFEEIRQTQLVSVFPVGLILKFGVSSPIVRDSRVTGFYDAFQVSLSLLTNQRALFLQLTNHRRAESSRWTWRALLFPSNFSNPDPRQHSQPRLVQKQSKFKFYQNLISLREKLIL